MPSQASSCAESRFELDAHDSRIDGRFRDAWIRCLVLPLDEPRQVVADGAFEARHAPPNGCAVRPRARAVVHR